MCFYVLTGFFFWFFCLFVCLFVLFCFCFVFFIFALCCFIFARVCFRVCFVRLFFNRPKWPIDDMFELI